MNSSILIIGGYGIVGTNVVCLLNKLYPELSITVGGRSEERALSFSKRFNKTNGVLINTKRDDLGLNSNHNFSAIIVLTNDLSDKPLKYAIEHGIPYTSIATQINHFAPKLTLLCHNKKSKVLIQDTSFAGIVALLGNFFARDFSDISSISVGVLMDENELGGPASQSDSEDFSLISAGLILQDSLWTIPNKSQESREYCLLDGFKFYATSFPSFDASEISFSTSAKSVRVDFTLGKSKGTRNLGKPSVDIVYEISGTLKTGEDISRKYQFSHSLGQTHLTAIGVVLGIAALLNNNNPPGTYLITQLVSSDSIYEILKNYGSEFEL